MHALADASIGTAGWAIPKTSTEGFPGVGTHLQRYARTLTGVEINSSFYRPHRPSTYAKWAASVPEGFRFAVKVPKEITHVRRLGEVGEIEDTLDAFLAEAGALGDRLGPLLVQLPPSLSFAPAVAERFFDALRRRVTGPVVCEPRHASWFVAPPKPAKTLTRSAAKKLADPQAMLAAFQVAQVAADPALSPAAAQPGGWGGLVYYRLHGSPTIYRSPYSPQYLDTLARTLAGHLAAGTPVWCIFDNTAEGAAAADALGLLARLSATRPASEAPAAQPPSL
jgi:uncharacterized protein YecE (DUF72 family)